MIQLPALPYPQDALAPHISERTMGLHYDKHHAGYVANLNKLLSGGAGKVGNTVGASGAFTNGAGAGAGAGGAVGRGAGGAVGRGAGGAVGRGAGGAVGRGAGGAVGRGAGGAVGGAVGRGAGGGGVSLETLITTPGPVAVFNNAAQIWNHTFYWRSMSPDGGGDPSGELASAITSSFGSVDTLRDELTAAATRNFASGWTWLVRLGSGAGDGGAGSGGGVGSGGAGAGGGELAVINTNDADNPLTSGHQPLLTIDIWEHAYYLDYQNARPAYIATFLEHLINWDFAAANYAGDPDA